MKKLAFMLIPLTIFASELTITRQLKTSINIVPKHLSAEPVVASSEFLRNKNALSQKERAQILSDVNQILARVRDENFCKGGGYSLEPIYNYEESRQKLVGYNLFSQFSCSFQSDELPSFNALINDMQILADKSPYIELRIPAIRATISYSQNEKTLQQAQDELLKIALNEAEKYSQITQKKCALEAISFDEARGFFGASSLKSAREVVGENADFTDFALSAPITKEEKITAQASVKFLCK